MTPNNCNKTSKTCAQMETMTWLFQTTRKTCTKACVLAERRWWASKKTLIWSKATLQFKKVWIVYQIISSSWIAQSTLIIMIRYLKAVLIAYWLQSLLKFINNKGFQNKIIINLVLNDHFVNFVIILWSLLYYQTYFFK